MKLYNITEGREKINQSSNKKSGAHKSEQTLIEYSSMTVGVGVSL